MNTSDMYQILKWDSDFFGFPVGKIIPSELNAFCLYKILSEMKRKGVLLVYWATNPAHKESQDAAKLFSGIFVDNKCTYTLELKGIEDQNEIKSDVLIEEYNELGVSSSLENLAIQSGIYSRFHIDPRISNELFEKLFKLWIFNSIKKEIADVVFIAKVNEIEVGMITLKKEKEIGSIGLISVDEKFRGQKIALYLIKTAKNWFIENDCSMVKVVTQGNNIPARRLYEKCGFCKKKNEYFYHIWI